MVASITPPVTTSLSRWRTTEKPSGVPSSKVQTLAAPAVGITFTLSKPTVVLPWLEQPGASTSGLSRPSMVGPKLDAA